MIILDELPSRQRMLLVLDEAQVLAGPGHSGGARAQAREIAEAMLLITSPAERYITARSWT